MCSSDLAQLRESLKNGELKINEAISQIKENEAIAKMKVIALLESMPGVGKIRAEVIMERLGIANSRRLRGLGPHQINALLEEFNS